ncbi:MAG: HDIG domain-containing protein [Candidatus Thermoplasmatota archaeon]|nr:HDIG domain-containing protein [Candidatus Thermoplasmatota archaeon]
MLPSRDECISLLRSNGCSEDVVEHCIAVSNLAVKIARRCDADECLVESGGLLHDIGRCRTHAIDHGIEGAKLARKLKLPSQVVKIIERHVGAGIDRAEARRLEMPPKDYSPKTLEEMIVAHADNLIDGVKRISVKESVAAMVRRNLHDQASRILALHRELSERCGLDVDSV